MSVGESADLVIVVANNQCSPIPVRSLQAIFDPLVQLAMANSASLGRTASMGLSLFIARQIVIAHSGTIDVTSSAIDNIFFPSPYVLYQSCLTAPVCAFGI